MNNRALPDELREFYKASPMREGVLCWYPFEEDANVLDLTGGALTELLKKRCKRVISDSTADDEQYDYIVAIDIDDYSAETLEILCGNLSNHGRLLLAYENPFALRYWSGKPSPAKVLPYYPLFGCDGRPGKAELQIRLESAGFKGQKWYYPLTDHWFAREVYSESYLPDEYLNQRFKPYMADYPTLQFDERGLYREVIRGGAFEFMCGAYLVEARACASDKPCIVDYAAVTAYREPANRFATAVCCDGTVHKIPLHPNGRQSLQRMLDNHEELESLGINIVTVKLEDGKLTMPRIEHPTLWDYWASKLSNGTFIEDEMVNQFDRLRDEIHKAAATGKCFWELVPANCFYDAEKDEFIFFDQEHCSDDLPDVAVARALWALIYPSAFSAVPQTKQWLERLKARYGLTERWDELSRQVKAKTAQVLGSHAAQLVSMTNKAAERLKAERKRMREDARK